jgi:hypothetical protein
MVNTTDPYGRILGFLDRKLSSITLTKALSGTDVFTRVVQA